ncbi:MAG: RNA polymerase sigma-70 factor [Ekhidna sp.]|uniref:RNA polymerase sigma-70 factor n=1 Tax=Ekhidna sp. TaxID=2608089 RepID=UPI0032ECDFBF
MNSDNDLLLFQQVKSNDFSAYEVIFKRYYKELYRFAFTYVRDATIAEEMAQEVFLYMWEKRDNIEIQTTLKTYLYSAVKNKCLNYIKLELPRQQSMADVSEVMLSVSMPRKDEGENERLKQYIQSAIDALPKKCRKIFILSRNAGMTYEEIAEELDLSKKTVENQMGIALKKLRESLEHVYKHYKEHMS